LWFLQLKDNELPFNTQIIELNSKPYVINGNKLIIDLKEAIQELEFSNDGKKLFCKIIYLDNDELTKSYVCTFLDWDNL